MGETEEVEMHDLRDMLQIALSRLSIATSEWRQSNNEIKSELAGLVRSAVHDEMADFREAMEAERRLTEERFKTLDAEVRAKIEYHAKQIEIHQGRLECHDIDINGKPTRDEFQKLVKNTDRELHDFELSVDALDKRVKELEVAPGKKALVTMASVGGVITTGAIVGFGPRIVDWLAHLLRGGKP